MSRGKWMKRDYRPAWASGWPAGIRQTCPRCGRPRPADDPRGLWCPECEAILGRRPPPSTPRKTIHLYLTEVRRRMARALVSKMELGKWPCIGCAHAGTLDGESTVICDYLADQRAYGLPPRPWPRPAPWQCLYHSDRCDRCTDLSMAECRRLTEGARRRLLMDRETGKIYRGIAEARRETGKEDEDFRRLAKEETEALRWAGEHEAGERIRIVIPGAYPSRVLVEVPPEEEAPASEPGENVGNLSDGFCDTV